MSIFKKKDKAEEADVPTLADGEVDAEAVMRKYDRESNTRIWEGIPKVIVTAVMIAFFGLLSLHDAF